MTNRVQAQKGYTYRVHKRTSASGVTPMVFEPIMSINTSTSLQRTYEAQSSSVVDLDAPEDAAEMERVATSVDFTFTASGKVDDRDIDDLRSGVGVETYFRITRAGVPIVQGDFLYSINESADWTDFATVEISFEQAKDLDWSPSA